MTLPATIENITLENAPQIYKQDGLKPFLEHIKEQVSGEVPDLSTKKGRDRIASLAAQVSRSKTAVEKPGREYLKHLKELPKQIEAELREFVNSCDELRDEIRKPLTEWENAEAARVSAHKESIAWFGLQKSAEGNSDQLKAVLAEVEAKQLGDHCEEFLAEYVSEKDAAIAELKSRIDSAITFEKQQAELEELRRLQAEREQKEREERIAREAAEAPRLEAEKQAQAQREAAERAERERILEAERREMQLKLQAEQAERQRIEAEQKAAYEIQQAELRAKQAAENERLRLERQAQEEKAEAERQAANKQHRAEVNREILAALIAEGLAEEDAKKVITLAAKNKAGRLIINY